MFFWCKESFRARFKEKSRAIALRILPFLIAQFIRILIFCLRLRVQISPQVLEALEKDESFCVAFWHGELLLQPYLANSFLKNQKAFVLISKHFDGEIISKVMEYFNIGSIRGSSYKGGIRALLEAIKVIESKNIVAITPDGPRGPYHSIADGIILLAQKTNTKIVISRVICRNALEFKSWDRFKIPKPFSKVEFIVKAPLDIKHLELKEAKELLKQEMEKDI
ncbi:MAG: lysophospholipid acyltransferase family protein [Helicobacter sp.]|nr:lysophospholipid acyltransferase family protein [Helicobacteraceae bacterium]MDY3113169.1 lysophospholipid acyltransferase family protein [Helicobacter sp.]